MDERELFWQHVDRSGGADVCWLWQGPKLPSGYGRWSHRGQTLYAHRVAYEHEYGPLPEGMFACHDCPTGDNPSCCNPQHLYAGTPRANSKDRDRKGRGLPGGKSPKLTADQVREIRRRYSFRKVTQRMLAAEYGCSVGAIDQILRRVTWVDLEG